MRELISKLAQADKESLGLVRTHAGLQVAEDGEWIWLRGVEAGQPIPLAVRQVPANVTFEMDEQENLFPLGGVTPIGKLKKLRWLPLLDYVQIEMPTSAMPGRVEEKYPVRIVPSTLLQESKALLTMLPVWRHYADSAPEVRLSRLRFALAQTGEVLIWGTPLPAIPGKEYWMQENMLLPAGFDFEIPWIAGLVAGKLNPLNDAVILFTEEGSWEKIEKKAFVPATRSAIRLTGEKG
jgi:hypothetical protein